MTGFQIIRFPEMECGYILIYSILSFHIAASWFLDINILGSLGSSDARSVSVMSSDRMVAWHLLHVVIERSLLSVQAPWKTQVSFCEHLWRSTYTTRVKLALANRSSGAKSKIIHGIDVKTIYLVIVGMLVCSYSLEMPHEFTFLRNLS